MLVKQGFNGSGVQDLRAKVGEFCGLIEGEFRQAIGVIDIARIVVMESVDICPYFNF